MTSCWVKCGSTKPLVVGDGPRDEAAVPRLVERLLSRAVAGDFVSWSRLHQRGIGRGYERKLRYAVLQGRSRGMNGVVATVDSDRAQRGERLQELRDARESDRTAAVPLPVAVGEAVPHLEAWLLDDPHAVRTALRLAANATIPSVRHAKTHKGALQQLIRQSDCDEGVLVILAAIAKQLDPQRCRNAKHTGFEEFADDVQSELGNV